MTWPGTLQSLAWREPLWLLLALQPLLLLLLRRIAQRRRHTAYADSALQPWIALHPPAAPLRRVFSKDSATVLAWVLFAVAAAGPRLPLDSPGGAVGQAANLMLLVDVSRSMQAGDIPPSRLRRARLEIDELLDHLHGERVGLIVFAARPHLFVPLTTDYAALRFYLESLDTLTLPTAGSRPAAALALAHDELRSAGQRAAVLMLSDGDFGEPAAPAQAWARRLGQANTPLYILGTGTTEGDAIPLETGGWLTHEGRAVISRLDAAGLRRLAALGGGAFTRTSDDESDWDRLYRHGIAEAVAAPPTRRNDPRARWRELYPWALLPAILLLGIALLPYRLFASTGAARIALLILALTGLTPPSPALAAETEDAAYARYAAGDFAAARDGYKTVPGYAGRLGEAASRYQLADYTGAIRQFSRAVLLADSDTARAAALFNLGNSYFQSGDYAAAAGTFTDALLYRPRHAPSRHNLALSVALTKAVKTRLREAGRSARPGAGPQRARADRARNLTENNALAVDEAEDPRMAPLPLPTLPNLSSARLEALIEHGLEHIRLATGNAPGGDGPDPRQMNSATSNALLRLESLAGRQALLWKRLLEIEEGFPAPLKAPRPVPEVEPW